MGIDEIIREWMYRLVQTGHYKGCYVYIIVYANFWSVSWKTKLLCATELAVYC